MENKGEKLKDDLLRKVDEFKHAFDGKEDGIHYFLVLIASLRKGKPRFKMKQNIDVGSMMFSSEERAKGHPSDKSL